MKKNFCRTLFPTPLLNRPDFSKVFGGHPQGVVLDESGLLFPLEKIILEGECLEIIDQYQDVDQLIFEVKTEAYPCMKKLFIDARFVETAEEKFPKREFELPNQEKIISYIKRLLGYPYVWGGNWSQGIPQMEIFYPIDKPMTFHEKSNWLMKGVDCSGLLYEATCGYTPRNTSDLIGFGDFLAIADKTPKAIAKLVKPLDLIVWQGHVIIVTDDKHTIESRARRGGVVVTDLEKRLEQILYEDKKKPASSLSSDKDSYYVKTGWI